MEKDEGIVNVKGRVYRTGQVKSDQSIYHQDRACPDKCKKEALKILGELVPHYRAEVIFAIRSGSLKSRGMLPIPNSTIEKQRNVLASQLNRLIAFHAKGEVDEVRTAFRNMAFHAERLGLCERSEIINKTI